MATRTMTKLAVVAGLAWLVVAGYGLREAMVDNDSGWQLSYAVFSVALLAGAGLTVTMAGLATGENSRPRLRTAGVAVGGLGCALALVGAWALPVWMTLLGIGFALLACASEPGPRRAPLVLLAAGQLAGIAVLIASIEAEVGRRDDYGDYPAAGGIALLFVAGVTIVALVGLVRAIQRQGDPTLVLGVRGAQ